MTFTKKYDIDYSTQTGTDVPDELRAFTGEKVKAFFVPSVHFGREVVELIRRTGISYETVTYDRAWDLNKWGIGDYYDIRAAIWDFHVMHENLEAALTSDAHYDVMIIPGINGWSEFTAKTRQAILKRVEEGAGLVLVKPFHGQGKEVSSELTALSPLVNLFEEGFGSDENAGGGYPQIEFDKLSKENWVPNDHYITRGIPFHVFPYDEIAYYPYSASADSETIVRAESGAPIAAVKNVGRGKVVAFSYYPRDILPQHADYTGKEMTFDPIVDGWKGAFYGTSFNYLEYFYQLIYRSMIWASGKEPEIQIASIETAEDAVFVTPSKESNCTSFYKIIDVYDNTIELGESRTHRIDLPERIRTGGTYRIEVYLKQDGQLMDFGTVTIQYEAKARIIDIAADRTEMSAGETVQATIRVAGDAGLCEIKVVDDFDNVLNIKRMTFEGDSMLSTEYTPTETKSQHIHFQVDLIVDGVLIEQADSARIVVTPATRHLTDFEVYMSPQNRGQGDLLPLVGKIYREMGITGLFPGSANTVAMSGARGLGVYWYHRGAYVERKEKYLRTKDKTYLHRVPCLNDPKFWSELQPRITETIRKFKKYGPVSYFANDEGSLTCYVDELDLCFCSHCMEGMQAWLKTEYSSLDELNRVWATSFASWEEAEPHTLEEAQKTLQYASWADHRRFMERTFVNAYRTISEYVRDEDEGGVIRMSGCQASTAYSGYDYYELHRHVGYFEAYGVGNQYEFHHSFARPNTIVGGWFGYGADGLAVQNQIWHAIFHNLTLISIFWEYSCLNPDFTLSRSARDMSKTFLEVRREGIGKLLLHNAERDSLGIAIHYSMHSIHGSRVRGDQARYEANRQGWIHLLEDAGYQYRFVASQQIEAGELIQAKYKVLILPYSIALSAKEAEAIQAFAQAGGTVIGDFQTGLMDVHCRPSDQGALDALFGIERLTTEAGPFYINREFKPRTDFTYMGFGANDIPGLDDDGSGLVMAEAGIRAGAGKAAFNDDFMGTVAAVIVNDYGQGKGVYLNFGLDRYSTVRSQQGGGAAARQIIERILSLAGADKPVALKFADGTKIESGCETVYYRDQDALYVGILRNRTQSDSIGHDGLAVGGGKDIAVDQEKIVVELANPSHLYDIRSKAYLGHTDRAEVAVPSDGTALLAVLPHKVNGVKVDAVNQTNRGIEFRANISVDSDKPELSYVHVLSISVYSPSGEYEWMYADNVTVTDRSIEHSFFIPYNAQQGQWTIIAKEVASGITAQYQFEVI